MSKLTEREVDYSAILPFFADNSCIDSLSKSYAIISKVAI